jgi:uncharacterized MAPEG superfamily protein
MSSVIPLSSSKAIRKIVYAWALAFAPHVLKIVLLNAGGYKWDNKIGRYNMSKDVKDLPSGVSPSAVARARRADAAHQNGMESFPLFAAAVLSAVAAGVDSQSVDNKTMLYVGLRYVISLCDYGEDSNLTKHVRVAYNAIFILGESEGLAGLRTLIWGGSVYSSISLLLKSANVLAAKGL